MKRLGRPAIGAGLLLALAVTPALASHTHARTASSTTDGCRHPSATRRRRHRGRRRALLEVLPRHLVLHCLPGPMHLKAHAIANVAAVLDADGVLFGATVLGRSAGHGRLARAVLPAFNAEGSFDNLDDSEAGLREILGASFRDVEVQAVGSVAYFRAANPLLGAG